MDSARQRVIEQIRAAFKGVVLGSGIGLFEGQGIDDYEDEADCKARRIRDEKTDWEAIPPENLNECFSSLSFFDAEGMRFHLPAFMVADIRDQLGFGSNAVFHLTELEDYARSKFVLLSPTQRLAIRSYLVAIKADPNYEFDRPKIERSLKTYWNDNISV